MSDPPIEDGWQRWRGETNSALKDIRADVGEIKVSLMEHIKDEIGLLRVILVSVLSLLTAAGVAVLVYVLNHL